MTSLLPQFQEEENKNFDEITFCYIHHGRIPASCDQCFLQKQVKLFLSSSHSRLIDKIVEMVEGEKLENTPDNDNDLYRAREEGFNSALNLIQSKLKQ